MRDGFAGPTTSTRTRPRQEEAGRGACPPPANGRHLSRYGRCKLVVAARCAWAWGPAAHPQELGPVETGASNTSRQSKATLMIAENRR